MENKIVIEDLTKTFKNKKALNHVNLEIKQGMFGLLGPNGAGKSTLMKILTTLIKPTSGNITVCGVPITDTVKIRSMTGYLPQDFSMYGNMTAYEALDYLAVLSGIPKSERKIKVLESLELVNLSKQVKTKVKAMSGGMKRRLGIAQAIIHNPKIIIVDEPTAGLDPEERVRFRNLLCELAEERIVLLSTHIVGDVEATCEQIALLAEGELVFQGSLHDLLATIEGNVYSAEIVTSELPMLKKKYLVTGILTTGTTTTVKIVADTCPLPNAKTVTAGVEDAYLYLMHQKEQEV